jgi:DNA-binding CsgD family transcriptional regulator
MNEYLLTAAEVRSLDAVIEHKCDKAAADAIGVAVKTVTTQINAARKKMNAVNRLDAMLQWDRFRRTA